MASSSTAGHCAAEVGLLLSSQVSSVHNTLRVTVCITHALFASVRLTLDAQRKRYGGSGVNFVTAANFFPPFLIQLMMLSLPIFLLGLTDLIFVLLIGGASISIVKFLGFGLCTVN